MMKLPPQVNTAFEMLEAAGYEAYGSVASIP